MFSARYMLLLGGLASLGVAVPGCGSKDAEHRSYPKRYLPDFEASIRADSSAAARFVRDVLGVQPPLRLDRIGGHWDGGSVGGRLLDATGDTLRFTLSRDMDDPTPGYLYLGAEYYQRVGARRVAPGSDEEKALTAALFLYGDRSRVDDIVSTLVGKRDSRYHGENW